MRKSKPKKRYLQPDSVFNDEMVTFFVNNLMWDGKKSVAFSIFYDAMKIVDGKAEEGSNGKYAAVHNKWNKLLGQHVIKLPDHKKLAETIITAIMINEGMDKDEAMKSWDQETANTIRAGINFRT
jgi:hypothetical protein